MAGRSEVWIIRAPWLEVRRELSLRRRPTRAPTPALRRLHPWFRRTAAAINPSIESSRVSAPQNIAEALPCEHHLRHKSRLPGSVLFGVGAAFDFHSGAKTRAAPWMRNAGLEWLHRFIQEPRRLWRRYLILAPEFAVRATGEQLRLSFAGVLGKGVRTRLD